ncbi:MAG: hypothetical protein AAGC79_09180 [Pseudomonadota bacterium]
MGLSTTDAVRETFLEATRQSLARNLKTSEDWDRYKAIVQEADARIAAERAAHAHDYPARLAEAKEIILREEHGARLDQPLPPGAERQSDKDALHRKADARVRQDHDQRIAAIKADELDQYRSLTAAIRARDAPQPRQAFERTRPGPSRA